MANTSKIGIGNVYEIEASDIALAMANSFKRWTMDMKDIIRDGVGINDVLCFLRVRMSYNSDEIIKEIRTALHYWAYEHGLNGNTSKMDKPKEHPNIKVELRRRIELVDNKISDKSILKGDPRYLLLFSVPRKDGQWHNVTLGIG